MEFKSRFLRAPARSFFLFGPRGTGKPTWIEHCFPEALVADLLHQQVYSNLNALRNFREDYPECEPLLVYRGKERLRIDDILCVPADEFLGALLPSRGTSEGLQA